MKQQELLEDVEIGKRLALLKKRTKGQPTDADSDIDFAYQQMAMSNLDPLSAPSTTAWEWYLFARLDPVEFLKICAKREDAKTKQAGTITNQRMEDDKRQQFAVLDRIERQLTVNVEAAVMDLMTKFPDNVLTICYTKFREEWDHFIGKQQC